MSEKKIYRESEVTGKKDKSTWLIIHDNVYDVTKFLEEVSHKLITSQYLDWSKSRTVTSIMSYFTKVSMSVWKVLCNFSMNDLNGQPFEMNFERFFFFNIRPQVNIVLLHVSWYLSCIRFSLSSRITDIKSQLKILNAPNQWKE